MAKNETPRRREVRRTVPRPAPRWLSAFHQSDALWTVIYVVLTCIIAGLITLAAEERVNYDLGQKLPQAVVARVAFRAQNAQQTAQQKMQAYERQPSVYAPNTDYFSNIRGRIAGLPSLAVDPSIENTTQLPREYRALEIDEQTLEALREFITDGKPNERWMVLTRDFVSGLADVAILKPDRAAMERNPDTTKSYRIVIRNPSGEDMDRLHQMLLSTADNPSQLIPRISAVASRFPPAIRPTVVALVMQDIQPTYLYDKEETLKRAQAAADRTPVVEMNYEPGNVLVKAGEPLTQLDLEVLQKEREFYRASLGGVNLALRRTSHIAIVGLIAIGFWTYVMTYQPVILAHMIRGLMLLSVMMLAQSSAVGMTLYHPEWTYGTTTFPVLLSAMILAISYDQRFSLAASATIALLVMTSLDLPLENLLVMLTGIGVVTSLLREVRTRSRLLQVGLWAGAIMAVAVIATGLAERAIHLDFEWRQVFVDAVAVFVMAFAAGLLTQGILPLIESMFDVSTSMTLKELNDASHPLLRRLAQDAPGTYQHSLRIADMGEAAADAIGANGLLCRVGAMYHDIGKINKPLYFVENQGGGPNRHDKLSPAMSLLIIVGHVKDGVEMAREYNLPKIIRHFIESHHGTTLVEYFYHAARKKSTEEDSPAPTEFEFRYPGPKPRTKEAAITMICDGAEGAARALPEPTPARIEQLVHKIANARLLDGQFDECNLTLKELKKIEDSITKTLCAVYHGRVQYPSQQQPPAQPAPPTSTPPPTTQPQPPRNNMAS